MLKTVPMLFRLLLAAVLCSLLPHNALAARKKVTLAGETCSFVLTYDTAKTEKRQLEDTFELLVLPRWAETFGGGVFAAKDIDALKPGDLAPQCKASIDKVKSLKLVAMDGVEKLRGDAVERIEDSCAFEKALQEGYRDPSALLRYAPAASCSRFVNALEGKSDLTAMFDEVLQNQCKDNASTKDCLARGNKKRGDAAEMKVEVQTFGWNNCAVGYLKINAPGYDEKRRKLADAFLKRFKAREVDCEEP
jgi:hypothetical protein